MVTIKEQRHHIKAIKRVTNKINKGKTLGQRDYDIILRALACHMAVIELDIKKRKDKEK